MRYVRLNKNGPKGMALSVACQQLVAAKMAAGNSEGELLITLPNRRGDYYVAFSNHAHATQFIEFLGSHNVARRQRTALPAGVSMQPLAALQTLTDTPPGVKLMAFDGSPEQVRELFAGNLS